MDPRNIGHCRTGLAGLFTEMHQLATGRALTKEEARAYFEDPSRLVRVVEHSGVLDDPQKRSRLEQLIATAEPAAAGEPRRKAVNGF